MGSSTSCSLVFTPTGKPFYWPGETVSGHVVLEVRKSIKSSSIRLTLWGQRFLRNNGTAKSGPKLRAKKIVYLQRDLDIPMGNGIFRDEVSH